MQPLPAPCLQDDPRWYVADPVCTFLFAGLVMWTTRAILRDISDVLMERVPRGLCIKTINDELLAVSHGWSWGVVVCCLYVWGLVSSVSAMGCWDALFDL